MGKETGSPSSSGLWLSDADVTLLQASRPHLGCKSPGPSTQPLLFVTASSGRPRPGGTPPSPSFCPSPWVVSSQPKSRESPRQLLLWVLQYRPLQAWRREVMGCCLEWRKGRQGQNKMQINTSINYPATAVRSWWLLRGARNLG